MFPKDFSFATLAQHVHDFGFESLDPSVQQRAMAVMEKEARKRCFEKAATTARYWMQSGDSLFKVAKLIHTTYCIHVFPKNYAELMAETASDWAQKHEMRMVYFFLAGLAIENYAKGCLVAASPGEHVEEGKLKKVVSHNCRDLVAKVFRITDCEKQTLTALSNFVSWRGRYPVATSYEKPGTQSRIPVDFVNIDSIVERLKATLQIHIDMQNPSVELQSSSSLAEPLPRPTDLSEYPGTV
jgi:hypothetical protein